MNETAPKHEQRQTPERQRAEEILKQLESLRTFVRENPDSPLLSQIRELLAPPEDDAESEPMAEEAVIEEPAPEKPAAIDTPDEPQLPERPAEKSEQEASPFMTFEKARGQKAELSDAFIQGALTDKLQKPGTLKAPNVKHYFDRVAPDESDKEFIENHEEAIAFHDKLGDFITKELRVHAPAKLQGYLDERKREFFATIEEGSSRVRQYVEGWEKGLTVAQNPLPRKSLDFRGLTVPTTAMSNVDLLESKLENVEANLYMQQEIMGNFLHWSSERYIRQKTEEGRREPMERRIYLNPRPQDSVEVFSDLVHALDSAGVAAKAKIYDWTFDSEVMNAQEVVANRNKYDVRADGIIVYGSEEKAEEILRIVQEVRQKHEDSFKGRQSSSVPFEIGEGIAIGDEPKKERASLTSHRADVIGRVVQKVRSSGETDPDKQVALFRDLWRREALGEGINPDNPAFNHG